MSATPSCTGIKILPFQCLWEASHSSNANFVPVLTLSESEKSPATLINGSVDNTASSCLFLSFMMNPLQKQ